MHLIVKFDTKRLFKVQSMRYRTGFGSSFRTHQQLVVVSPTFKMEFGWFLSIVAPAFSKTATTRAIPFLFTVTTPLITPNKTAPQTKIPYHYITSMQHSHRRPLTMQQDNLIDMMMIMERQQQEQQRRGAATRPGGDSFSEGGRDSLASSSHSNARQQAVLQETLTLPRQGSGDSLWNLFLTAEMRQGSAPSATSLWGSPLNRRRPEEDEAPRPRKIPRSRLLEVMEAASLIVQDIDNNQNDLSSSSPGPRSGF